MGLEPPRSGRGRAAGVVGLALVALGRATGGGAWAGPRPHAAVLAGLPVRGLPDDARAAQLARQPVLAAACSAARLSTPEQHQHRPHRDRYRSGAPVHLRCHLLAGAAKLPADRAGRPRDLRDRCRGRRLQRLRPADAVLRRRAHPLVSEVGPSRQRDRNLPQPESLRDLHRPRVTLRARLSRPAAERRLELEGWAGRASPSSTTAAVRDPCGRAGRPCGLGAVTVPGRCGQHTVGLRRISGRAGGAQPPPSHDRACSRGGVPHADKPLPRFRGRAPRQPPRSSVRSRGGRVSFSGLSADGGRDCGLPLARDRVRGVRGCLQDLPCAPDRGLLRHRAQHVPGECPRTGSAGGPGAVVVNRLAGPDLPRRLPAAPHRMDLRLGGRVRHTLGRGPCRLRLQPADPRGRARLRRHPRDRLQPVLERTGRIDARVGCTNPPALAPT